MSAGIRVFGGVTTRLGGLGAWRDGVQMKVPRERPRDDLENVQAARRA